MMDRIEQISRRLKLRQLSVLAAVVQCGSMAKAAERLAITQPVVSKAIADLENTLGVRLLDRGPKGVKRSVAIFNDLRASVSEIEVLANRTAGELRIGAIEFVAAGLLPALIDRLARQYPRLSFEVVQADPETLKERELRGRNIELAIMRTATHEHAEDLEEAVLFRDRLRVVAGAGSPWAGRRKISLADLVDEPWCLPPPEHAVSLLVVDAFQRCGLKPPRRSATAGSAQVESNLVAKGHFLGVLGTVNLHFNPARDSLKILPVEFPAPLASLSVVTLKGRTLSPAAQLFIDCIRDTTKRFAKLA
jgi:DNA-binding transcriptional LysR family regulator